MGRAYRGYVGPQRKARRRILGASMPKGRILDCHQYYRHRLAREVNNKSAAGRGGAGGDAGILGRNGTNGMSSRAVRNLPLRASIPLNHPSSLCPAAYLARISM